MTKEKNNMSNEIKKGDYILVNGDNTIYKVLDNINGIVYEAPVIYGGSCKKSDAVKVDKRTAFLTRLQSLLSEFDARIYEEDCFRLYIDLDIHMNEKGGLDYKRIVYSDTDGEITADNIMDFNKE